MKRETYTISFQPEHKEMLTKLVETTGMNSSEIIQMMIEKVYADQVEQEIIMQNYIKRYGEKCGKKRLLRIMSIRSMRKKLAAQRASLGDRCPQPTKNDDIGDAIERQYWKQYSIECITQGAKPSIYGFAVWKEHNAARLAQEAMEEAGL